MEDRLDSIWRKVLHPHALRIGDEAVVVSDGAQTYDTNFVGVRNGSASEAWGFPCTIVGFAKVHVGRWKAREERCASGFYYSPYFPQVRFDPMAKPYGVDKNGYFIHAYGLMPVDQSGYRRRIDELFTVRDSYRRIVRGQRLSDLPDTKFWEGDWVRVREGIDPGKRRLPDADVLRDGACQIARLDFRLPMEFDLAREKFCCLQSPEQTPRYALSGRMLMSGHCYWNEDELELAERGNFWKIAHGKKPEFSDLAEEAHFFCESGESEVAADADGRKFFRKRESAQAAVMQGFGHGIRYEFDGAGWDSDSWWEIIRYRDDELGARVIAATAEGFVIPSRAWLERQASERRGRARNAE